MSASSAPPARQMSFLTRHNYQRSEVATNVDGFSIAVTDILSADPEILLVHQFRERGIPDEVRNPLALPRAWLMPLRFKENGDYRGLFIGLCLNPSWKDAYDQAVTALETRARELQAHTLALLQLPPGPLDSEFPVLEPCNGMLRVVARRDSDNKVTCHAWVPNGRTNYIQAYRIKLDHVFLLPEYKTEVLQRGFLDRARDKIYRRLDEFNIGLDLSLRLRSAAGQRVAVNSQHRTMQPGPRRVAGHRQHRAIQPTPQQGRVAVDSQHQNIQSAPQQGRVAVNSQHQATQPAPQEGRGVTDLPRHTPAPQASHPPPSPPVQQPSHPAGTVTDDSDWSSESDFDPAPARSSGGWVLATIHDPPRNEGEAFLQQCGARPLRIHYRPSNRSSRPLPRP